MPVRILTLLTVFLELALVPIRMILFLLCAVSAFVGCHTACIIANGDCKVLVSYKNDYATPSIKFDSHVRIFLYIMNYINVNRSEAC